MATANSRKIKYQCRVMLVEDDPTQVLMYKTAFNLFDCEVYSEKYSAAAISSIKRNKPDIILLDLLLGNEYGLDVLEEIKADKDIGNIPVVILSNYVKEGLIDEAKKMGALDFWVKSHFVPREIVDKVKRIKQLK